MSKIKQLRNNKIKKECTNCFRSNHIVFNFAYITYEDDFEEMAKQTFIDRIREVSSVSYLELMAWPKYKGFEEIKTNIKKEIPTNFNTDISEFDGKYSIMRLYKNNEPTPGRIIGKIVNKVFYIFYIDVKGQLYKH